METWQLFANGFILNDITELAYQLLYIANCLHGCAWCDRLSLMQTRWGSIHVTSDSYNSPVFINKYCLLYDMLLDLLQKIFEQAKIPEEWRDSVIVPIFKEKGDIQDCGNYRVIKMISHTMKIWERIIDRRLRDSSVSCRAEGQLTPYLQRGRW